MKQCRADEVALKGLFLGPQAENSQWVLEQVETLLKSWFQWRKNFRPSDGVAISPEDMNELEYKERRQHTERILKELALRFESELPKFSPRYIGHMFSEVSLPALFGHVLTLLHNPNNISAESSLVGTEIEEEAIQALGKMMGFAQAEGHFTSGGTVANFEAVYRALGRCYSWLAAGWAEGQTSAFEAALIGWEKYKFISDKLKDSRAEWDFSQDSPYVVAARISERTASPFLGPVLLVPQHKHYSWTKAAHVFGVGQEGLWPVQLNTYGHLDIADLKRKIEKAQELDRPVAMVVSVLGTTELGMVDPIHEVQEVLNQYKEQHGWHIWHHVDAAYGGFLCSLAGENEEISGILSESSRQAISAVHLATSVTIDPHKLGYVPYASGAFLTAKPLDYYQRSFGGPYVDFSQGYDKGLFTLEGSRSAAGAVATWMTARCVGLDQQGYGKIIARTIRLRQELETLLQQKVPSLRIAPWVDANLLGFCVARRGESLREANKRTLRLYETYAANAGADFFVSKTRLYRKNYAEYLDSFVSSWGGDADCDELVLIRLCIMNPFFKSVEMNVDLATEFAQSLTERLISPDLDGVENIIS